MPPIVNKNKCIGCFQCAENCPTDAFGLQNRGWKTVIVQYPRACKHCNACVLDCPIGAVSLRFPVPWMMVSYDAPEVHG